MLGGGWEGKAGLVPMLSRLGFLAGGGPGSHFSAAGALPPHPRQGAAAPWTPAAPRCSFRVSCASAYERSMKIKGDASVQGGAARGSGAEVVILACFWMLFATSWAPGVPCTVGQMAFRPPAVPRTYPRRRCASRGRPGLSHFGSEVEQALFQEIRRTGFACLYLLFCSREGRIGSGKETGASAER